MLNIYFPKLLTVRVTNSTQLAKMGASARLEEDYLISESVIKEEFNI